MLAGREVAGAAPSQESGAHYRIIRLRVVPGSVRLAGLPLSKSRHTGDTHNSDLRGT